MLLGYVYTSDATNEGETRIFSRDSGGSEKFYIKLTNAGKCELNGTSDYLVKYSPLNSAQNKLAIDINTELVKIAAGINAIVPGSYVVAPITIDISGSKVENVSV